jgi:hypothetical protein
MSPIVVISVLFTAALWFLWVRLSAILPPYEALIRRLPEGHYDELCEFTPDGSRATDPLFWTESCGNAGQMERLRIAFIRLQIVQSLRKDHLISRDDARVIWFKLFRQALYTLVALGENDIRHKFARKALKCYCEILLRTNTLCETELGPKCLLRLPDLL